MELKEGTLAPKSYGVEKDSLKHLKPYSGQRLVTDIDAAAIARYIGHRRKEKAADKSIKLEIGTLRGILKRAKVWSHIRENDDLLPKLADREDAGRAINSDEETALLAACLDSRSRGLYTAVVVALNNWNKTSLGRNSASKTRITSCASSTDSLKAAFSSYSGRH